MAADRFVLKQFAGSATNNGAFGAAQATGVGVQPVADIKDVQSLSAFEQGWNAATLTSDKLPALEEMQGLEALLCKALKENYSEGIPFWIAGETYFQYSFVNYNGVLYYNTTGSYTNNNPAIDTSNWAAYNKVGTATVGTDDTPIYLNVGTPTAGKRIGIVAYDNTKTYSLNNVVLNIESNEVKLYQSLANNNTSALTDPTKWKEVSLGGGTRNIGETVISTVPLVDAGLHLADGSLISGSGSYADFVDYMAGLVSTNPDLFETEANWQSSVSTYGVCGKYVYDSVNNTIRLPKIEGFIEGTLDPTKLGDLIQAGLPNITGNSGDRALNAASGAFYTENGTIGIYNGTTSGGVCRFDASRSNSIYGNSSTVQPQSIKVFYYVVIATSTKTDIQVDIDEIATDLNGKADVDASNFNVTGISKVQNWNTPNYNSYTQIANDSNYSSVFPYTITDNGYLLITADNTSSHVALKVNGGLQLRQGNSTYMNLYYKVQKGDVITSVEWSGSCHVYFVNERS